MARVAGSVTVLPPAAAPTAPLPEHVVDAFGVGAMESPAGSVSTNTALNVASLPFGLVNASVSVDVPPEAMVPGAKLLARDGAALPTVSSAEAAEALLPFEVCSAPAAMVFK